MTRSVEICRQGRTLLSQELNNQLTRVDKGQPAGEVLRHYWQPAALAEELDTERPVVPVTLFGEKLVLFRDSHGVLGLLDRACPHRGVDLCYGRLENDGLRCPFHGWKFAANGQCMEQPGEPEGSEFYKRLTTTAYPVVEKNGIIFAYMGPGEPPPFPNFDCFRAPSTHVFAFKGLWECNWLQALEVGIDPTHASFLHRFLEDEDPEHGYGRQFRDQVSNSEMTRTEVMRRFPRPDITVDETEFGLKLTSLRHMDNGHTYVRISNAIFPSAICIAMSREMTITQWHVPIDNDRCYWYSMFTSFDQPVDKTLMREQRMAEHQLPDYAPLKNRHNNYHYNPREQATLTYTGMGMDINVHDQWAVESMGTIQDRTKEHLGQSDVGIKQFRQMLRAAMKSLAEQSESALPMRNGDATARICGPVTNDTITATDDWESGILRAEQERRATCPWDASL
tara:strand:- start:14680 stop:16035 length:1356 start_codon:yes stop_codon:yes gene_type:complete